jgi:hypothetical protein
VLNIAGHRQQFFCTKSLLTRPSNVWQKKIKYSRLLEGDGVDSKLPFKIFSTLKFFMYYSLFLLFTDQLLQQQEVNLQTAQQHQQQLRVSVIL